MEQGGNDLCSTEVLNNNSLIKYLTLTKYTAVGYSDRKYEVEWAVSLQKSSDLQQKWSWRKVLNRVYRKWNSNNAHVLNIKLIPQ